MSTRRAPDVEAIAQYHEKLDSGYFARPRVAKPYVRKPRNVAADNLRRAIRNLRYATSDLRRSERLLREAEAAGDAFLVRVRAKAAARDVAALDAAMDALAVARAALAVMA